MAPTKPVNSKNQIIDCIMKACFYKCKSLYSIITKQSAMEKIAVLPIAHGLCAPGTYSAGISALISQASCRSASGGVTAII